MAAEDIIAGLLPLVLGIIVMFVFGLGLMGFVLAQKAVRLRLKYLTKDGFYWKDFLVIEKLDPQTGNVYWKSVPWQGKITTEKAPQSCIYLSNKGKLCAEGYVRGEGELLDMVWIKDAGFKGDEILEESNKTIQESFRPFTATQREALINQYIKSREHNKPSLVQQLIQHTPMLILGLVVILGLIFSADIMKEYNSVQQTQQTTIKMQQETNRDLVKIARDLGIQSGLEAAQVPNAQRDDGVGSSGDGGDN